MSALQTASAASRAAQPVAAPRTVLATDLDGTFVGGSQQQREDLYAWLRAHRDEVMLIFVSGRGQAHMRELAHSLDVQPEYFIGDVGTTVEHGQQGSQQAIEPVRQWLGAAWPTRAAQRIDDVMRRHPRLSPQPVVGGRRKSYFYDDEPAALRAAVELRTLGFDVLLSDNQYFDVLPRGVQKGPTLLRTLRALRLSPRRTLVAGDTLNDLSMFRTGLCGVAVGNREPALDRALRGSAHVHRSSLPGAAGVLEALQRFHASGGAQAWLRNW